ncbi:MAG: fructose-bisphosphate aldolase class I [Hyphomicrobiales bacterium]|nr:fructose-bisphosphate aldolase class I [Hyphomicrobiales bacterium]
MAETLEDIAAHMVAKDKGILAADESTGTITKRFDAIGIESTADSRRDYREMLFRSDEAMRNYVSGVILYDETIRQSAADGTPLVDLIKATGAIPGIKVDTGAKPLAAQPGEKITEGLDGLRERLAEYHSLGARFAKWRAVIDIGPGRPSHTCISANAHALGRYAALCQEAGIVPIVEPEVMMDGPDADHDIDTTYDVTERALKTVFQELYFARVRLEGMVLKPNMIVPGSNSKVKATPSEVAEKTVRLLKNCVPTAVPGIAFLSGGQSNENATEHLCLINQLGPLPWAVTYSYGRALQSAALETWGGKPENVAAAQRALLHRARMNSLAAGGTWTADAEKQAA